MVLDIKTKETISRVQLLFFPLHKLVDVSEAEATNLAF
jgi:hypothetical protein